MKEKYTEVSQNKKDDVSISSSQHCSRGFPCCDLMMADLYNHNLKFRRLSGMKVNCDNNFVANET